MCRFFFSSRRRHTRWPRDWSSDVCSSDLVLGAIVDADEALLIDRGDVAGAQPAVDELGCRELRCVRIARGHLGAEIGRASCRERGAIAVVEGAAQPEV